MSKLEEQEMTTERNVELLNEVADFIELYPERHHQTTWVSRADGVSLDTPMSLVSDLFLGTIESDYGAMACGTTQCVAGWAAVITLAADPDRYLDIIKECDESWWDTGQELLGLTSYESDTLFNSEDHYDFPAVLREIADGEDVDRALRNNEYKA